MARAKREDHTVRDDRTLPIFIHSTIDDMTDLSPDTMRVYMHLSRRADKSGAAWPSYQSIGDHCFVSVYKHPDGRRKHAVAAVAELVKAGLIKKEKRMNEHGQQTNAYVLLDPVTVASQPGGTPESQGYRTVASQPAVIAAYPDPVTVASPKGSPIKDTPLGNGIISSSDDWDVALAELLPTLSGVGKSYLAGSYAELADTVDGVALYRIVVEPRAAAGVEWLTKQVGHSVRRTLGSILHKSIDVEFVAAEPAQEDRP